MIDFVILNDEYAVVCEDYMEEKREEDDEDEEEGKKSTKCGLMEMEADEDFNDSGEDNKKILMNDLLAAGKATQEAFEESIRRLSEHRAHVSSLADLQATSEEQMREFRRMITTMDSGQFHTLGSVRLRQLIMTWRDALLRNLEAVVGKVMDAD